VNILLIAQTNKNLKLCTTGFYIFTNIFQVFS
jgi:hypothetical protein